MLRDIHTVILHPVAITNAAKLHSASLRYPPLPHSGRTDAVVSTRATDPDIDMFRHVLRLEIHLNSPAAGDNINWVFMISVPERNPPGGYVNHAVEIDCGL